MNMTNKNNEIYTVRESITALLTALEEMGLEFDKDSVIYGYERNEGQTVSVSSDDIPDFEIGEDMLAISDFEWIVQEIEYTDGEYVTTFLLEDAI